MTQAGADGTEPAADAGSGDPVVTDDEAVVSEDQAILP